MEVSPTFVAHPSELELLYFLRRRLQDGEIVPWIHAANIYGGDPVAMTAQYAPATAANGKRAWYFVCTPEQKQPKDPRIKRVAGAGTWKEERGWPLVSVSGNGVHEHVGWKRKFSYLIKAEGKEETATRLGWTMLEIKLSDSTATCLCKIYQPRQRYKHKIAQALNLSLMPLESPAVSSSIAIASGTLDAAAVSTASRSSPNTALSSAIPIDAPVATGTSSTPAPLRAVSSPVYRTPAFLVALSSPGATLGPATQIASAVPTLAGSIDAAAAAGVIMAITSPLLEAAPTAVPTLAGSIDAAAAAGVTMAITSPLLEAAPTAVPTLAGSIDATMAITSPLLEAAPTRPVRTVDAPPSAAPTSPSASPPVAPPASSSLAPRSNVATIETSPPKRWVQVQISDSPTKAGEKSLGRPKRVYSMVLPGDEGSDSSSAKKLKPIECKGWLTIEPMHGTANSVA